MPSKSNPTRAIQTANRDEGMCLKDFTLFHAFNENGAMAIKLEANKAINKAIDDGVMLGGAYWAYGAMNNHHEDAFMKQAMRKSPNKWKAEYHAHNLVQEAKKAHIKIAEAYAAKEAS